MITKSFIPEPLQSFNYYLYKLPLYLQSAPNFVEHFRIWYDILAGSDGLDKNSIVLVNLLNIFDKDYLAYISNLPTDSNNPEYSSDILDKLATLFGVSRNLRITYTDELGLHENEMLTLTNKELLVLIKARIVQNNYDGTKLQANEYYKSVGLNMYMITDDMVPATANLYLIETDNAEYVYTENIRKLFLADLLTIKAMGITYRKATLSMTVGIWDSTNWDEGDWGV